jgi:hypothetical protein
MRRNFVVAMILALAFISAWNISYPAFGEEQAKEQAPAFTVARIVIATGIENREPVGVSETFPVSAGRVFCFLEATNITDDTEVTFVWYLGEKEMFKIALPLKKSPRWRTYCYKNLMGKKGDWKVELKDSAGNSVKTVSFKVE